MKKFVCPVCGYLHEGECAPVTCPYCGIDETNFVEDEF